MFFQGAAFEKRPANQLLAEALGEGPPVRTSPPPPMPSEMAPMIRPERPLPGQRGFIDHMMTANPDAYARSLYARAYEPGAGGAPAVANQLSRPPGLPDERWAALLAQEMRRRMGGV